MMVTLNFLSDNSSISIALILTSTACLFFFSLGNVPVWGMMSDILLKSGHFQYYVQDSGSYLSLFYLASSVGT